MSVSRTGSALRIDSSANSGSDSTVDIPVDCVGVLMLAGGWPDAGDTFFTGAAFTLDGDAFTFVDGEHADGSHNNTTAWFLANPSTGDNLTFAWDWGTSTAPSEGMSMFLIFLSSTTGFATVKSFGGAAAESSSGSTGAMDADTGDYAAAVTSHSGSASFTGATELFDATFNGAVQALAEQASPSGAVTISVSASDFVAITGVVIHDEEPPPPPPWTRHTVADNGTLAWSTVNPAFGDLVIVLFANDGGDDQSTPTSPEALTRFDAGNVGSSVEFGAYYRICDGTETGNIVSTTVAAAADGFNVNTEEYGCHVFHIAAADWHGTTPPELTRSTAATGTPNAPSLTPSWGSAETLWIVALTRDDDDGISSVGSDYADNFLRTNSSSNGPEIATSARVNEASSEDPGASTVTGTAEEYIIYTIAVRPAPTGTPATVTPDPIAAAVTLPSATVTAASNVTPTTVVAAVTLPAPSPLAASLVTPDAIAAAAALPDATIVVSKTVTPAAIAAAATLPGPTVLAAAVVEPLSIEAVAALPSATPSVGQIVQADPVDVTIALPTASIQAAAIVTPAAIAAAATLPGPTASVAASVAPAVIAIAATLPGPSVTAGATVTPLVIEVNVAFPSPTLFTGILEIVARAFGQFHRINDRLHLAKIGRGGRRGFAIGEGWERVSDPFIFDGADGEPADQEKTMLAVSAAWATHSGSDAATLKAAIHSALDALGYRRTDGTRLV